MTSTFSGPPEIVTADLAITHGLIFRCFGNHDIGAPSFTLTGGWSAGRHYTLTGSVNAKGRTIGIRVEAEHFGAQFDGIAYLDGPGWCDRKWGFSLTQNVTGSGD